MMASLLQDRAEWRAPVNTGNGASGSVKGGEFLYLLSGWLLLKKQLLNTQHMLTAVHFSLVRVFVD
jgi:hypothetical protein